MILKILLDDTLTSLSDLFLMSNLSELSSELLELHDDVLDDVLLEIELDIRSA